MTFQEVLEDIKKLIGLELHSIRPGANITITDVDEAHSCLTLKTSAGVTRSRPLSELQLIWNEMNKLPAVHVDDALHGSGTSRNQPETVLANLPYVEWLKLNNKKHIAFVGKNSHAFGTLKQMDSISAANLKSKIETSVPVNQTSIVIVTSDPAGTASVLQTTLSGSLATVSQGIYRFENPSLNAMIVSSTTVSLTNGIYPILASNAKHGSRQITIHNSEYSVIDNGDVKFLIMR